MAPAGGIRAPPGTCSSFHSETIWATEQNPPFDSYRIKGAGLERIEK